jgi:hypothetical protein
MSVKPIGRIMAEKVKDVKALADEVGVDYWDMRLFLHGCIYLDDDVMLRCAQILGISDYEESKAAYEKTMADAELIYTKIEALEREVEALLESRLVLCQAWNEMRPAPRDLTITEEQFRADPGLVVRLSDHTRVSVIDAKGKVLAGGGRGFYGVLDGESFEWNA